MTPLAQNTLLFISVWCCFREVVYAYCLVRKWQELFSPMHTWKKNWCQQLTEAKRPQTQALCLWERTSRWTDTQICSPYTRGESVEAQSSPPHVSHFFSLGGLGFGSGALTGVNHGVPIPQECVRTDYTGSSDPWTIDKLMVREGKPWQWSQLWNKVTLWDKNFKFASQTSQ